ncbi:hypothetical protein ACTHO0_06810 [Cytobacillus praedii]
MCAAEMNDNTGKNIILTKYDYHKNCLKKEIYAVKSIKIPTQNYSITQKELADWIIDVSSPKEIETILSEIRIVKKRTNNIKPFLATIAVGLINKAE